MYCWLRFRVSCVVVACCLLAGGSYAESCVQDVDASGLNRSLYWGDLHIHTSYSMDAYVWNNQVTPAQAYQFAKGQAQRGPSGQIHQLRRPLDFAAVTDHAEYFGLTQQCLVESMQTQYCADLGLAAAEDSRRGFVELFLPALLKRDRLYQTDTASGQAAEQALWQGVVQAANTANEPCQFTAFVGNEWTASPDNLHWHRNLIYANDTVPERAINAFDEPSQEAMWQALDARCANLPGCDVLAIPHNSNIGMGGGFRVQADDVASLKLRAKFEKLVEIHQHKGSSECYQGSVFTDEACNFEHMLPIPLLQALQREPRDLTSAENAAVASGYVRQTLAEGLRLRQTSGVNPFVYGFVGSTDTHAGRPGDVDEATWQGAIGTYDGDAERRRTFTHYNPGGLVGVWAATNTRADLFAALKRREVYATSGPRIRVRFDVLPSGLDEPAVDVCDLDVSGLDVQPMGSTLAAGVSPTFVVRAQQDEVPLAHVEIIKLEYRDGALTQQVKRWDAPENGRVDWCLSWTDETAEPGLPAAWYARVRQQPTMRWDGQKKIQERAWSSPIWSAVAVNSE